MLNKTVKNRIWSEKVPSEASLRRDNEVTIMIEGERNKKLAPQRFNSDEIERRLPSSRQFGSQLYRQDLQGRLGRKLCSCKRRGKSCHQVWLLKVVGIFSHNLGSKDQEKIVE